MINNHFGIGSNPQPIWMDQVSCLGYENKLSSCPFGGWGIDDCTHSEDVSMMCDSATYIRGL